ncbi:MAG: hypothetical protein IK127_09220 [Clostridia bacterium]|nr:hypothetical protein [Clostridia bacterium]
MNDSDKRLKLRYLFIIAVILLVFAYLVSGLASLQLENSEEYAESADSEKTLTIKLRGKRGNIVDADSVILAEDEWVYNVTFYKDATQTSEEAYKTYTRSILDTIAIIEEKGGEMAIKGNLRRNEETQEWEFNFGSGVSDSVLATRQRQWRSNNYLSESKYPTAESCFNKLKERFCFDAVDPDLDEESILKVMAIYCEMQMNIFNSQPIVIAKDVSYDTVIEVETKSMLLKGMEIEMGTKRVYPRHTLAAQIIGYTGAIPSQSMWKTLQAKGYSYNDTIGRDGIESSMEDWLTPNSAQRQGYRVVVRDQRSTVVRELEHVDPTDGNTVKLTLRVSLQRVAEQAIRDNVNECRDKEESKMSNGKWLEQNRDDILNRNWVKYPLELATHGCMVVLDMQDRVLALANYPTYDLNALVAGGESAVAILADERNLLLNYGIHARGTPGSIFKMVTGYGALNDGVLQPNEHITDMGYYTRYNKDLSTAPKCWATANVRESQHKFQTIVEGLSHSCNYFFYECGARLGEDRLYYYATLFGLTSRTGIDLPGEVRSVVGCQNTLYDPTKPMNEANQDTSIPIIAFNSIKRHLKNCGASRGIEYDDERLSVCAKRLMDMAVNYNESDWLDNMRTILMEELSMTKAMVYTQQIIGDTYNYMNEVKWGGGQTILTAIGQSVTTLTPIAVARYVCAVANNGYVYNVSLVDSIISPDGQVLSQREPQLVTQLENGPEYLGLLRKGMEGVVDDQGTAASYFKNWKYYNYIAAKTGTAQVTSVDLENNAWFVCFAPVENPEIAIAVFIPHGASGGYASLAAKKFIEEYLNLENLRTVDYNLPYGNSLAP